MAAAVVYGCAGVTLGQVVHSFSEMPGAGFLDVIEPPNCNFPIPTITVNAGGRDVVMTTTMGASMTSPYFFGCFNWDGVVPSRQNPPNPAVNPGNFRGHHNAPGDNYGDLILDFSEPLTGFGITSFLDGLFNSNGSDTIVVYDGPLGAGNVLGVATTGPAISGRLSLDFAGVVMPAAQIRSARVLMDNGFFIDGYAAAAAPSSPCGSADFNGDGDVGTDADIAAFFDCLGGLCCATCDPHGADFNGDGDLGTDADIESFFRVLGGGPC
jgi:hypothetical protein